MLRVLETQAQIQFYKLAPYPYSRPNSKHQPYSPTPQNSNIYVQLELATIF